MKTQEIVDLVIQFLFDTYWTENRFGKLDDISFVKILDNRFKAFDMDFLKAKKEKIIEIASRYRKDVTLDGLIKEFDYLLENYQTEELYFKALRFFTEDYNSKDIVDLGFLPQSCTSFCFYAFDLLKSFQVKGLKVQRYYHPSRDFVKSKKGGSVHSVLVYYDDEEERSKRCDPKWQKHPLFFKNAPDEYKDHFINIADADKFVHGKSEDEDKILWYTDPITLRE